MELHNTLYKVIFCTSLNVVSSTQEPNSLYILCLILSDCENWIFHQLPLFHMGPHAVWPDQVQIVQHDELQGQSWITQLCFTSHFKYSPFCFYCHIINYFNIAWEIHVLLGQHGCIFISINIWNLFNQMGKINKHVHYTHIFIEHL
jgi:hypothetical protein